MVQGSGSHNLTVSDHSGPESKKRGHCTIQGLLEHMQAYAPQILPQWDFAGMPCMCWYPSEDDFDGLYADALGSCTFVRDIVQAQRATHGRFCQLDNQ